MAGLVRSALRALIAFSIASCLADTLEPTKLASWLPKEKAALKTYDDYYQSPYASVCMRLSSITDCGIIGLFAASFFETEMGCCSHAQQHPDDLDISNVLGGSVGDCGWRYELFTQGPNVVVMTDVLKKASGTLSEDAIRIGSFSVQCDLNKSAEACGAACDDMIIEADGPLYVIPNAAIKAPIPAISDPFNCGEFAIEDVKPARVSPNSTALSGIRFPDYSQYFPKTPKPTSNKPSGKAKEAVDAETPNAYIPGAALVAVGPARISSRRGNIKYDQGYLQAVVQVIPNDERNGRKTTETFVPTATQFIADPWRFDLSLREKSVGSYMPEEPQYEKQKYESYSGEDYSPRQYKKSKHDRYYPREQYGSKPYRPYIHGRAYASRYSQPKHYDVDKGNRRAY